MIAETLSRITSNSENIQSDEPQRFPVAAVDGDVFRQGDIYIWKRDSLPHSGDRVLGGERQLAPGNTKGSRHVVTEGAEIYRYSGGDALQGPWLKVEKEAAIEHPEHGDVILPPGCYEITYQRQFAEELKRALD